MMSSLSTRPVTFSITILVVVGHALTVWAMASQDSFKAVKLAISQPQTIQIQLIADVDANAHREATALKKPLSQAIRESQSKTIEAIKTDKLLTLEVDKTPLNAESRAQLDNKAKEDLTREKAKKLQDDKDNEALDQSELDKQIIDTADFTEEQARWLDGNKPVSDLPSALWPRTTGQSGDTFIVLLELQVDIEGIITEVKLLESSGEAFIDSTAMIQVRAGKLIPFEQQGKVVKGVVPMSFIYEKP